jgi:hypothetical protein
MVIEDNVLGDRRPKRGENRRGMKGTSSENLSKPGENALSGESP